MANARVIEEDDPTKFYPGRTRRVSALVLRSASVTDQLVAHPLSRHVCDTHLLPNSEHGYQLHVSATIEVGPGAREQVLHREESSFTFFPLPRPNIIVASMWAVTEFTCWCGEIPVRSRISRSVSPFADDRISANTRSSFVIDSMIH